PGFRRGNCPASCQGARRNCGVRTLLRLLRCERRCGSGGTRGSGYCDGHSLLRTAAKITGGRTSGIVWGGMTEMTVQTKAPESQFAYVVLAARRARQIMAGAPSLIENPRTLKATRIACEELENSLIEYEFTEPSSIDEDKDGKKRRK